MLDNLNFAELLITITAVLITLTLHEYAHGYAAYKLGDNTAYMHGRLSLNPLKHLDPFGVLCMIFFRFGWAKPVPINPRNFKNPKRGFAITALAGPLTNIVIAFISALLFLLMNKAYMVVQTDFLRRLCMYTVLFIYVFHSVNIGLGVFNLIPIPPFDGSRILNVVLPQKLYFKVMRYERQIYWGLIAWLFLGEYVYAALMKISIISANPFLSSVLRIFALSDLISQATGGLSDLMIKFWLLFPFLR